MYGLVQVIRTGRQCEDAVTSIKVSIAITVGTYYVGTSEVENVAIIIIAGRQCHARRLTLDLCLGV